MMNNSEVMHSWDSYKLKLKNLTPDHVRQIDEFVESLGGYGEVVLVVQNGELRYINKVISYKAKTTDEEQEL